MNNSLTNNKLNISERQEVKILNSISSDISQLRTTMLDSSLKTLKFNLNRKNNNNKFFEFGKIYQLVDNKTIESRRLSILFCDNLYSNSWIKNNSADGFFVLKNIVYNIFRKLSIQINEKTITHDGFENCLGIFNKKNKVSVIGKISSDFNEKHEIKKDVYYASLDIDLILDLLNLKFKKYSPISKFPTVNRELNFLIDTKIDFSSIQKLIMKQSHIKNLESMSLSDVYQDDKLPEGKKSYTLSFNLMDKTKTLSEKEISSSMSKIQSKIENEFSASLRS